MVSIARIWRVGVCTGGLALALGLGGCAATGSGPAEHWHNFEPGKVVEAGKNAGSAVFIREPQAFSGPAANIFVNGEYLASLLPGGFKQSAVCIGSNRLTAHVTDVSSRYLEKEREGKSFDIAGGEVAYFRVVPTGNGSLGLERLDATRAQALIAGSQEQTHTVPRVDRINACGNVAPLKSYSLNTSALFAFNRGDAAGLLPQGQRELRAIAADIASQKASLEHIDVIGHTDPEGSDGYNLALSRQRAQTVAQVLGADGLPPQLFRSQGRGEQQLLVKDCSARHLRDVKARNACNQPNRRVEVVVHGRKQGN